MKTPQPTPETAAAIAETERLYDHYSALARRLKARLNQLRKIAAWERYGISEGAVVETTAQPGSMLTHPGTRYQVADVDATWDRPWCRGYSTNKNGEISKRNTALYDHWKTITKGPPPPPAQTVNLEAPEPAQANAPK